MFIFYEFRPFLYRKRARYLSKNTVFINWSHENTTGCMHLTLLSHWPNRESNQYKTAHIPLQKTMLFTYLLTPWNRVLKNLTGSQLAKKFPVFYGTRRFITASTSARHLYLSWARSIQSMPPNPTYWRSTLRFCWVFRVVSIPQVSPPKPVYTSPLPHTCCIPRPSHSSRFDHPNFFLSNATTNVHMNLRGFPPGCGDSVADFWGWDAHEARLRCPDDVSGDIQEDEIPGGALSQNQLTNQTMVTTGIFPYKEKFPW
jgi:hypothetical protein